MKKIKLGKIKIKKKNKKDNTQDKPKKGKVKSIVLSAILICGIAVISIALVFALYIIISSPDFDQDKLYSKESSVLYYADGVTELARLGAEDRVLVTYDDLPQVLVDAIVATEDSRFFQHKGMDVARFIKASFGQLLGNDAAGGASTITMQLVKQVYTDNTSSGIKGIIRKFTDIYMAVFKVESNYTKEEIIEFYVNTMWFAGSSSINTAGIYGVEQASQYYFGKSVSDLTLAEASIMAGMFQNPYRLNPYTNPEGVRDRQEIVLTLMVNHGYITESEKEAVLDIPIESLVTTRESNNGSNQAVIDYIVDDVTDKTGMDPRNVPMEIISTINPDVQNVLNQLENGEIYEFPNEDIQESIVITSTEDGSIVALSGGRNYEARGLNRATERRQPGSTAKPIFDYGPYIEYLNGSPATLFLDEPTTYSNGTSINNSDRTYMGLITMRTALMESRNIPALLAFQAVYAENPDYISDFVHSLGIDYGDNLYESASIGGLEQGISPVEMSAAYATFGRGGYYIEPYSFTKATILETGEVYEHKYEKERVMSEETAYLITDILVSAAEDGVGGVSVSGTTIAAKSGTTNVDRDEAASIGIPTSATRDAWNVTYSPEYCIALWLGYDRTTAENYLTVNVGSRARNAIMRAVGTRVYSQNQTFTVPSGIVAVEIERETFPTQLASEYTPASLRTTELFKEGTEPTDVSTRFAKLEDPTNGDYTFDGTTLRLSWDATTTPDAINTTYLQNYFNTYYGNYASKYYEQRLNYNNSYVGTLGYQIYRDDNGTLTYVGRTEGTNYTLNPTESGTVTYVIKSAYSIFTSNMSDGLEITVNLGMDSNVDDIIDPDDNPNDNNNNDNNNNNNNRPNTGLE